MVPWIYASLPPPPPPNGNLNVLAVFAVCKQHTNTQTCTPHYIQMCRKSPHLSLLAFLAISAIIYNEKIIFAILTSNNGCHHKSIVT